MCDTIIDKIDDIEINRIEKKCKDQKHLSQSESLTKRIQEDEAVLEKHNITFRQLKDFFEKIKHHITNKFVKRRSYTLTEKEATLLDKYNNKISNPKWRLWSCRSYLLFNDRYVCVVFRWDGAELCPFQSLNDKRNHGYEYGSYDWIFINRTTFESIHIGDLLFHEITEHHFFQSLESEYRVDPEKLIKLFNLKPNENYSTNLIEQSEWSSEGCSSCSKRWYPNKKYSLTDYTKSKSDEEKELISTMTHKMYGSNHLYYNDEKAILIVNNAKKLPEKINGLKYDKWNNDSIGHESFMKKTYKTITLEEETTHWI